MNLHVSVDFFTSHAKVGDCSKSIRMTSGPKIIFDNYSPIQYKGYNPKFKFLMVYGSENILFLCLHFT